MIPNTNSIKKQQILKLRTVKFAYWVFCVLCQYYCLKHNGKLQILTLSNINNTEVHTIRFSNFNRIRILFGFGKSGEYEYEDIRFWKIIPIQIWILFGLKTSAEYEYEITIRSQLFEYYSNTELFTHLWYNYNAPILYFLQQQQQKVKKQAKCISSILEELWVCWLHDVRDWWATFNITWLYFDTRIHL